MSKAKKRATMQDVARIAQTSTAVVSYVINDGPRPVSQETRARVLAAIEQAGYIPDRVAQGLARGKSMTYGLVLPDITNPYFAALAHALEDELFAHGRSLLLGNAAEDKQREVEVVRTFLQNRVDGLFYVGVDANSSVEMASRAGVPVVVLDRIDADTEAASVSIDNVAAAREATEHLIQHGYDDIVHVSGPFHLSVAQDRIAGYTDALAAHLSERQPRLMAAPFTRQGGLRAGRVLFAESPPQAVFAANEQQAIGLLRAAAEAQLRVPQDVAVVAFDGTPESEFTTPQLSTITQPILTIAREAVRLLLSADADSSRHVLCEHVFVQRESCGAHPAKDPSRFEPPQHPTTEEESDDS